MMQKKKVCRYVLGSLLGSLMAQFGLFPIPR